MYWVNSQRPSVSGGNTCSRVGNEVVVGGWCVCALGVHPKHMHVSSLGSEPVSWVLLCTHVHGAQSLPLVCTSKSRYTRARVMKAPTDYFPSVVRSLMSAVCTSSRFSEKDHERTMSAQLYLGRACLQILQRTREYGRVDYALGLHFTYEMFISSRR